MGRALVLVGIVLIVIGILMMLKIRVPFIGRLPGDIVIERENFRFYIPIASSILISIIITLLIRIFSRIRF